MSSKEMLKRAHLGSKRYTVRIYESRGTVNETSAGTLVAPVDLSFNIYADSGLDAEQVLQKEVLGKRRPRGCVYQIFPAVGNAELIRSLAVSMDGTFSRVFLSPTDDVYSELRRIRPFESNSASQPDPKPLPAS